MPVRSKEELIDSLAEASKIRRKELITLDQLVVNGRSHECSLACRMAIVLSYAHWEGFVKEASQAYIDYIAFKAPPFSSLALNFQAVACRGIIKMAMTTTKRIGPYLDIVKRLTDEIAATVHINSQDAIDTESNLNSEVFLNICQTIGVDYFSHWSKYGPFIDDLVKIRCAIAHGELLIPDKAYAREVLDFVGKAITWFRTDVENAVVMSSYLRG